MGERTTLREREDRATSGKHAFACPKSISAIGKTHPVRPGQGPEKLRRAGRLASGPSVVTKDGAPYRNYGYDANGNRTSASEDGGAAVTGTYDAQDRLTSYGATTYTHNAMGQRTSKTTGSDTSTYDYDELGNLMQVNLPNKTIDYVVDGQGRRVARKVDGTITNRYLYGQGILPTAELNADGSVKSQFVYASKAQVPDLMIKAGVTYRFVTDNVGSVRMVVNTTDGTIAQRIDYDPFGKVVSDSNPGFQPFGFAGGLYDTDTGLVRFGARDYDPDTGRFTNKDPILFEGGDTNLYAYVGSDPVNRIDPFGLDWLEDLNDSVGGFVDGLTTIPFTDFSLMGALRDHMVDGGIAADVNVCSWGYGYANRIGQLEQAGLTLVVAGTPSTISALNESYSVGRTSSLFGRWGIGRLNTGSVRIGWGWNKNIGRDVFRIGIGGPKGPIWWHIDIL